MNSRIAGILFLIATAAGLASVALLGPAGDAGSMSEFTAHKDRITLGALMIVVMAAAIALIPPMLFPVLRKHNESLALGYAVTRAVEAVLLLPAAIGPLILLTLGSSASDGSRWQTSKALLLGYEGWGPAVSGVFFCTSVIFLNYLLYRSRLVPRWISVWALAAVVGYFADGLLVMFGAIAASSPMHSMLIGPLALNELVLALWLLAKGFRPAGSYGQAAR
jgi:hypothetical protein